MKLIRTDDNNILRPWFSVPSFFDDDSSDNLSGLNLYEDESNVYAEVAVPGLDTKDIDVNLKDGVLTIRGAKEQKESEVKKGTKVYTSSLKSSFYYTTSLPSSIDSDKVEADLENGVLKVTIGKSEKSRQKSITVTKRVTAPRT